MNRHSNVFIAFYNNLVSWIVRDLISILISGLVLQRWMMNLDFRGKNTISSVTISCSWGMLVSYIKRKLSMIEKSTVFYRMYLKGIDGWDRSEYSNSCSSESADSLLSSGWIQSSILQISNRSIVFQKAISIKISILGDIYWCGISLQAEEWRVWSMASRMSHHDT